MENRITVLVADDHPIFRKGLVGVIASEPDLHIVSEAEDGAAALESIRRLRPRIAVLDLKMPKLDGLQVARMVRDSGYSTEIIFLTMHAEEEAVNDALEANVSGYVLKDSAVTEVVASIRSVASGRPYLSPGISSQLIGRRRRADSLAKTQPGFDRLTPTERRILQLLAEYKTSKEIASALRLSHRTVENHRNNICAKLSLKGVHALVKYAVEHRLLLT